MGTNYYRKRLLTQEEKEELIKAIEEDRITSFAYKSDKSKHDWEVISSEDLEVPLKVHIGKSSYGWQFLFNHNDWKFYEATKESIQQFIESGFLEDEYGEQCNFSDFWENCVEKKKDQYTLARYWHDKPEENKYNFSPKTYEEVKNGLRFSTTTEFS